MMDSELELLEFEQRRVEEDETEVFAAIDADAAAAGPCGVKGLDKFSHRIDDREEGARRIADPSERLGAAYAAREAAAEEADRVAEEESALREKLREEIEQLESELQETLGREDEARGEYRRTTGEVMRLEMEEPCLWNETYGRLKAYVEENGDLPPAPSACSVESDRRLSIFVRENKSLVYSKSRRMTSAPHRIEALGSLGVEWIRSGEDRWNDLHRRLLAYQRRTGAATLPPLVQCRKSRDRDLVALRHWVDAQEAAAKSGALSRRRDRVKKLREAGLSLPLKREKEWEHFVGELLKFRSKYGHVDVAPAAVDKPRYRELSEFVSDVVSRLKRKKGSPKLKKEEMHDLRVKCLLRDLQDMGRRMEKQGGFVDAIPLSRVKEVNYWAVMLQRLRAYRAEHGTLELPPRQKHNKRDRYTDLRDWTEVQRENYANKTLEESRIKELSKLGFSFDPWNEMFNRLRRYKKVGGTVRLPKEFKSLEGDEDEDVNKLCQWVQDQLALYRKGVLAAEKKTKLRNLGVKLTKGHMGKVLWEERFEEMVDYYRANKTCLPKTDGKPATSHRARKRTCVAASPRAAFSHIPFAASLQFLPSSSTWRRSSSSVGSRARGPH